MTLQAPAAGSSSAAPHTPMGTTVGQLMRPTMPIEPGAHLAAAEYLIKHSHDPALVVTTDGVDHPVATITDDDVTRAVAAGDDLDDTRVDEVVTSREMSVDVSLLVEDAARLMMEQGVDRLPVVNGEDVVGVVELADLLRIWTPSPNAAPRPT